MTTSHAPEGGTGRRIGPRVVGHFVLPDPPGGAFPVPDLDPEVGSRIGPVQSVRGRANDRGGRRWATGPGFWALEDHLHPADALGADVGVSRPLPVQEARASLAAPLPPKSSEARGLRRAPGQAGLNDLPATSLSQPITRTVWYTDPGEKWQKCQPGSDPAGFTACRRMDGRESGVGWVKPPSRLSDAARWAAL
jgi:hypothetical protein